MNAKFSVPEVFSTSWGYTKSQIWILAGLLIGMFIISTTLGFFAMPTEQSVSAIVGFNLLNVILSTLFSLGYTKNVFQTLDGIEPQFSAYGQQASKLFTALIASILVGVAIAIGTVLFILPGFYLMLRTQFFMAFIVEEDAGILESIERSWKITEGQVLPLLVLALTMIGLTVAGVLLFVVGLLFAMPLTYVMYCYSFRKLNSLTNKPQEEATVNNINTY